MGRLLPGTRPRWGGGAFGAPTRLVRGPSFFRSLEKEHLENLNLVRWYAGIIIDAWYNVMGMSMLPYIHRLGGCSLGVRRRLGRGIGLKCRGKPRFGPQFGHSIAHRYATISAK